MQGGGGGTARATQINQPMPAPAMHDSSGPRAGPRAERGARPGRSVAAAAVAVAIAAAAVAAAAAAVALPASGEAGGAWAQTADTLPTLGVILADTPPHHYKDDAGRTVVVGQVVNNNGFAVSGVKVWVGFYGASADEPVATSVGTTLIGVVPAGATAPFAIASESPGPDIVDASVAVLGFNYASEKPQSLRVEVDRGGEKEEGRQLYASDRLAVDGTVSNEAPPGAPAEEVVTVHMIQYDAFDPPRLLRHASAPLDGPLEAGASARFSFDEALLVRADGVYLFAESGTAASNTVDSAVVQAGQLVRRVAIGGAYLSDADGNRVQSARAGSPISVSGDLSLDIMPSARFEAQDYTFHVQVKRSGERPYVEFLGSHDGTFDTPARQSPSVQWTPGEPGLYFVETFVWDRDGSPIASRGPVVLVLVSRG